MKCPTVNNIYIVKIHVIFAYVILMILVSLTPSPFLGQRFYQLIPVRQQNTHYKYKMKVFQD